MYKLTTILFFLFIFIACSKDEVKTGIPDCIGNILEKESANLLTVQRIEVDGDFHYWLNTGASIYDGPEYIVNSSCDTVCVFCFCKPVPSCHEAYQNEQWEIIWSK